MSIGELAAIYERKELDVHPKFQRVLRWSPEQKTRLIESILLRIPIPPIFLAQDESSRWDVVDGVQRLGTIFEFLGILRDENSKMRDALRLSGTILVPELEGKTFNGDVDSKTMGEALRLDFQRSRLDLQIILKESSAGSKYELFERLNTGGSIASPQEVRNCVLVWMNEPLYDWMLKLSKDSAFVRTTPLSERLEEQQFRLELLLRLIVFFRADASKLKGIKDLSDVLNEDNRKLAADKSIKLKSLSAAVEYTFKIIDDALSGDAFRKFDSERNRFSGAFLISAFEAIAMGVAHNVDAWKSEANKSRKIVDLVKQLWGMQDFTENIGIGISSSSRMQHTVTLGRKHFPP